MTWWHSDKKNILGPNTTNTLSVGIPADKACDLRNVSACKKAGKKPPQN